jgi:hypothetical protein
MKGRDIDGHERALDYLGTEGSFTFSLGFRKTFTGRSAGMPLVEPGQTETPARRLYSRRRTERPGAVSCPRRWRDALE